MKESIKKTETKIEVLVIGGGASGMIAAGRAGECSKKTIILEKNGSLGSKLKITGGGRCNITNANPNTKEMISNYGNATKFLHSSFSTFSVKNTFNFFQSKGLPLVVQGHHRAFPKSEKALDVFLTLEKYLKQNKVDIRLNSKVEKISFDKNKVAYVETKSEIFYPDKVILATGGVSHPETGSTGDGFNWLQQAGHKIKKPTPDIVPLSIKEDWPKNLSGLSLDNIKITFYCSDVKQFSKKGRLLFTHFGISGPMILNSAAKVRDILYNGNATAVIDLFPTTDLGVLEKKLISVFNQNKNKALKNILSQVLPAGFSPAFKKILPAIDISKKVHSITKEERKLIIKTLKNIDITINGLMGLNRAVVSDGGVLLEEIETKTMQSKIYKNLYITGDLLHISRPSGGYSLQLCWTTGYIAGSA